jgi:hypothetical protein
MATLLRINSAIKGNGSFVVNNSTPLRADGNGFPINATLDVSNLSDGETLSVTADGVNVLEVSEDGHFDFNAKTKRQIDKSTFEFGFSVTNGGSADVVLIASAPRP